MLIHEKIVMDSKTYKKTRAFQKYLFTMQSKKKRIRYGDKLYNFGPKIFKELSNVFDIDYKQVNSIKAILTEIGFIKS